MDKKKAAAILLVALGLAMFVFSYSNLSSAPERFAATRQMQNVNGAPVVAMPKVSDEFTNWQLKLGATISLGGCLIAVGAILGLLRSRR